MEIREFRSGKFYRKEDVLADEEALEIVLAHGNAADRKRTTIAIAMRSRGMDEALVKGFLFTENIISDPAQISHFSLEGVPPNEENKILVELREGVHLDTESLKRHVYTNSSCGVCAKTSIESVFRMSAYKLIPERPVIDTATVLSLPGRMQVEQEKFRSTGGIHATGVFDLSAECKLATIAEDVGRHNAMDKAIGLLLGRDTIPLKNHLALVSGRASFELVQKCAMAGIPTLCAIGAPSNLAVSLAEDLGMSLVGFLRGEKFNVYCGRNRIVD